MAISRSAITKRAWAKRKREGGKGKCYHCGRILYVGGITREGHKFHRVCYHTYRARRMRYGEAKSRRKK